MVLFISCGLCFGSLVGAGLMCWGVFFGCGRC